MQKQDFQIGSAPPFNMPSANYYSDSRQSFESSYTQGTLHNQSIKFNDNAAPFEFREQKSDFELDEHFPSLNESYFGFNQSASAKPFQPTIAYSDNQMQYR